MAPFSTAMEESLLLPAFAMLLGVVVVLFMQTPRHLRKPGR